MNHWDYAVLKEQSFRHLDNRIRKKKLRKEEE